MTKNHTLLAGLLLTAVTTAQAGGILTNTNQSIDFLRNPARDAAIGLDGVYSNPAGVAFLPEGFHIGLHWQYAHQTRTITTTSPTFALGRKNSGLSAKTYEGVADAPCIPSVQAAWNKGDWSVQFNFSVPGGGGKCEFADGLGSFEKVVGEIAQGLITLDGAAASINGLLTAQGASPILPTYGVKGYDMDGFMEGRQYYFGFQLGTAYKIYDNLSIYGGLRLLYGTATYKARIRNIQVGTEGGYVDFGDFLLQAQSQAQGCVAVLDGMRAKVNDGIAQYEAAGVPVPAELANNAATLAAYHDQLATSEKRLEKLSKYAEGVNLLCNQSGVGVAPVIGADYRFNRFNVAAKYEFKTQIRMKNESTVFEASEIDAVNKYRDGEDVNEDSPAQLAVGVQWNPVDPVRVNVGYHHFFDKDADWYANMQEKLDYDTNEYLAGVEWDITDKLTVSGGGQLTRYGLTDDYMNDMSFVVNSYSLGIGFNYKATKNVTLKAAYFQTNYEHYKRVTSEQPLVSDDFTRSSRVLGVGCEIAL